MERCKTITYQGKDIYVFDYEGLRGTELLNTVKAATQVMLKAAPGQLLVLANFTDTYVDEHIVGYLTSEESRTASKNAQKIAAVGITGLKKLFFNMYNAVSRTQAKACDTMEAAKEYLVS